jgi:hypothetical protein
MEEREREKGEAGKQLAEERTKQEKF